MKRKFVRNRKKSDDKQRRPRSAKKHLRKRLVCYYLSRNDFVSLRPTVPTPWTLQRISVNSACCDL